MGRRKDIRRIGAIMRHGGADGSLVAWVEAELERVDFDDPAPGCLATLAEDLTAKERQLIVSALLTVAIDGPSVRADGLDAACRLGRELGFDGGSIERLLRDVSGWSLAQARELARRGLPASTRPATLAEARRARQAPTGAAPDHSGAGPQSLPLLDEVQFDLPDLTESGSEATFSGDVTDPVVFPERPEATVPKRPTHRVDDLTTAADDDEDDEDIGEDPPTVEMSPDAVQMLLRRKTQERSESSAPPRFSPVADDLTDEDADDERHNAPSAEDAPRPLAQGLQELPPLDWGEGDAFTVNDFTLSERIAEASFHEAEEEEPTRFARVPREVQEMLEESVRRREPPEERSQDRTEDASSSSGTMDLDLDLDEDDEDDGAPLSLDPDEPPIGFGRTMDLYPEAAEDEGFGHTMDLEPDQAPVDGPPSLPGPSVQSLQLDRDFVDPPASDSWSGPDPHSTAELLDLDLDEAPVGAFDRALRTTGPLPVRPDPSHDLRTGEALRAAPHDDTPELSLDPDEPELSLDPDTGDRIAVARNKAVPWTPPAPDTTSPTPFPSLDDDDVDASPLQPLEQGLAAYWAPQPLHFPTEGDGQDGLTGELAVIDPGDVQGGLTGELKVLHAGDVQSGLTGELKLIDPGQALALGDLIELDYDEEQDGLTSELLPVLDDPPSPPPEPRARRRRRGSEGITQDLTLLVDGDPTRRKRED